MKPFSQLIVIPYYGCSSQTALESSLTLPFLSQSISNPAADTRIQLFLTTTTTTTFYYFHLCVSRIFVSLEHQSDTFECKSMLLFCSKPFSGWLLVSIRVKPKILALVYKLPHSLPDPSPPALCLILLLSQLAYLTQLHWSLVFQTP